MSHQDSLHDRGNALENQFFANLDAQLLEELKVKQDHDSILEEFARISGTKDTVILEAIYKLGVSPQSFTALRVFPLVAVAWADGTLDDAERLTIHTLASTHFLLKQSPAGQLLEMWLDKKPASELFEAWETYAKSLVASLPAHEADELKKALVNEIHTVATSSGGLLGWSAVSSGENKALKRIEAAMTRPAS
jgi:uncharacterized tellurite resistance protein B-like protein